MKASSECLYPTDVFLISCGMGCKRITVSDIAYIEAMKDNCIIHMVDGKRYTQSCPMGDIEPELNPNMFKRIHRSFIVNIRYIDMYYYGHVVLENGMEVHIGDKYRDALKYILSVSLPSEAMTIRRASRNASRRSRIKLFLLRIVPMNIIQFAKERNRSIATIQITFLHIFPRLILAE